MMYASEFSRWITMRIKIRQQTALCGVLIAATANWVGCQPGGPEVADVSGKVIIDGKPLSYGYIRFVPTTGRSSDSEIASDGSFTLQYSSDLSGAIIGDHRIEVAANEVLNASSIKWHAPKKYASIGTSDLQYTVTTDEDDVTIELNWPTGKGPYIDRFSSEASF